MSPLNVLICSSSVTDHVNPACDLLERLATTRRRVDRPGSPWDGTGAPRLDPTLAPAAPVR